MKLYFPIPNPRNKLTTDIANTIKEFYPIGLTRESPDYGAYPGTIKLHEIMSDNIGNNKNFKERWGIFLKKLHKELKQSTYKLASSTYGFAPSFSADLELERYEDESLIRVKRLSFAVSLIGPFFTIFGIDETFIKEKQPEFPAFYHAMNVITPSPYKEFKNDFKYLEQQIEKQFNGYQFVPISMSLRLVKGLHHDYLECGKVHNALFNHLFDLADPSFRNFRGDRWYGYGESNVKVTLAAPPPAND
ncbi:MAG TPA: hypothetical protein VGM63_08420 [Mucilaginibacter sp.]|jgi:hypothetical protein